MKILKYLPILLLINSCAVKTNSYIHKLDQSQTPIENNFQFIVFGDTRTEDKDKTDILTIL